MLSRLLTIILIFGGSAFADPLRPGGDVTHKITGASAFNAPAGNITNEHNLTFGSGNSFFRRNWVAAPASTADLDGVGPTFNARSCGACHDQDGRGRGYTEKNNNVHVSLLFRLSEWTPSGVTPHPAYGDQLNPQALPPVPGEAQPQVEFRTVKGQFADGTPYELRKPIFTFVNFAFGEFDENTLISPRVGPHLVGLGLIEALEDETLLSNADPNDLDGDGISGKANYVIDQKTRRLALGRFGWKANQPSLAQQNAAAFLGDMGLTTELFPENNCPPLQLECLGTHSGGDPEVKPKILDFVLLYTRLLGVPERREPHALEVIAGEKTFNTIGCASCHTSQFTTGSSHPLSELHNQTFYPYSDFLVHDMGEELADNRPDGLADGREWRTPPLWAIGLFQTVNKHQNLLHDARARGVEEAILWHGGEAEPAREAYKGLSKEDRANLVRFVNSL